MVSMVGEPILPKNLVTTVPARLKEPVKAEAGSLLSRVCDGDAEAVCQVFNQYYFRVIGFVRRYVDDSDIEDVTQEIFFHVFRQVKGLQDQTAFEKYLFRSAKNRCINWLRRKHRLRNLLQLLCYSAQVWGTDDSDSGCFSNLETVLEQLPEETRLYVQKFYVEKRSRSEIAVQMKESPSTVYRKISLSRASLLRKAKELGLTVVFHGRHGLRIQDRKE